MKAIGVLSVLALTCMSSAAPAASVINVGNQDTRVFTTTGERGTATTEVTRSGNTVTTKTTFQPKGGYQPMGSNGGGYKPTGGSGYNPMGSR